MSTHKRIDIICMIAVFLAIGLTVLLMGGRAFAVTPAMNAESSSLFTVNDLNDDWDTASATKIALSDQGSTISGNGAYVYDGNVYISYAGHYVLSGELTDGSIIVDADKNDKIWIMLDGVEINCDDDAAIRIEQADHVFLTLANGTENVISSGSQYREEIAASGVDGAIYSRDDLTINGTGGLVVNTEYHHGMVCNDDLVITGGTITINAVQDGIHANDSVCIRDAAATIIAGDDGITVSNDDESAFFYMESGSIVILDCYEGIEAIDITIAGGTIDITSTDDGINANGSGEGSVIRIVDGDITISNPSGRDADGLDSNGSIYIEGGRVFISVSDNGGNSAIDYGSENGGECIVNGGTVIACGGSTMAEGFDADSGQGFLMYNTSAAAGTVISLEDSTGKELLSEEIPYGFSSVVLSVPEMKVGDVCTLTVGDVQEQITIDNSSTSGFGPGGMFGGGMRHGREDVLPASGMIEPDDVPAFSENREFPDRADAPEGMPEGVPEEMPAEMPEGMPGRMEFPDKGNMAGGTEFPGERDMPENEEWQETDRAEMWGADRRESAPDAGQHQGNGMRSMQQDKGQIFPESNQVSSNISVNTLVLIGLSLVALLAGLLIAAKVKH